MNFLADECIDRQIVDRLRRDGHRIQFVGELDPGISDDAVLAISNETTSVLISADTDFGELVFRQGRLHSGVLLIRLEGKHPDEKADLVSAAITARGTELAGNFSVLTDRSFRVRRGS
jgi:predicted nuclease of predicted toxin-antitoxin system